MEQLSLSRLRGETSIESFTTTNGLIPTIEGNRVLARSYTESQQSSPRSLPFDDPGPQEILTNWGIMP